LRHNLNSKTGNPSLRRQHYWLFLLTFAHKIAPELKQKRASPVDLSQRIRFLRKKKGLNQGDLAETIGINPSHLSRLENGKYQPSVDALQKIAQALEVSVDFLLSNDDGEELEVKIENKSLSERLRLIGTLEDADQQALIQVIDSMLTKQRMKQLLSNGILQEAG
jgi:transcriptional regulator with XRE-family HTH domain